MTITPFEIIRYGYFYEVFRDFWFDLNWKLGRNIEKNIKNSGIKVYNILY